DRAGARAAGDFADVTSSPSTSAIAKNPQSAHSNGSTRRGDHDSSTTRRKSTMNGLRNTEIHTITHGWLPHHTNGASHADGCFFLGRRGGRGGGSQRLTGGRNGTSTSGTVGPPGLGRQVIRARHARERAAGGAGAPLVRFLE